MKFEINNTYFGFKLIEEKEIEDIGSIGRVFTHIQTGAKLVSIQNSDDNKVFSISFKTLPENSTGVFHILEHSVLCGSRKFPCKEPFVELVKGSLNTYLNAATYPDKTMYPIASRNNKDFKNLMDVYLDAVFYPNIYKFEEILKQEGWHYDIENKEKDIQYKGVVYNEMQGAYSSPESILFRNINKRLFPDTCYSHDSGGNPDNIPDLTYDDFLETHKKFYHPSNSYIYIYGDMNILDELKFIHENYLSDFNKRESIIQISKQEPFKQMKECKNYYSVTESENIEDKTYLSLSFSIGEVTNKEHFLAFDLLEDILLETEASPLKKALIQSDIAKDAFGIFNNSTMQTSLSIIVKNSNETEKGNFKKIVFNTLQELVDKGIDRSLIEATINVKEFDLKEGDYSSYPKGLAYNGKVLASYLYGGEPFQNLEFNEVLSSIKSKIKDNYFEKLIEDYLINNNHSLLYIVKPKKGLAEEKQLKIRSYLDSYKNKLSNIELEKLVAETNNLIKRQSTPDSEEDINKIPMLSISDVNRNAEKYNSKIEEMDNYKILFTPLQTNGIDYISMYFDARGVKQGMIPYTALLAYVLGKVDTGKFTYEQLSNEIYTNTGGIDFSLELYNDTKKDDYFYPKITVSGKSLHEKTDVLLNLMYEILNSSKFDNYKRLQEIIRELKSRLDMTISSSGHMIASSRVASYFSEIGKYSEIIGGFEFYKFVSELENNFNSLKEEILTNLNVICENIFNVSDLLVSIGSSEKRYKEMSEQLNDSILKNIRKGSKIEYKYNFEMKKNNEALVNSSKVQYVAKGCNFKAKGYEYSAKLQVLKSIANYDYLWNSVRVKGGAYGVFIMFKRNGNMYISSYRDPNLIETIRNYDNLYEYIQNFNATDREMTKYILGTISNMDTPLTNSMILNREATMYFTNVDYEILQKEREEILNTKVEDIKSFSKLIEECMKENYICVVGNKEKVKQNEQLFCSIININN